MGFAAASATAPSRPQPTSWVRCRRPIRYTQSWRIGLDFRVSFGIREWLFVGGIALLFVGFSASYIRSGMAKSQRSDEAKEAYLDACRPAQGEQHCAAHLDQNHEACFFVNDIPGGKFNRGYFPREEYDTLRVDGDRCVADRQTGGTKGSRTGARETGIAQAG
jgi:hypothetical protein